METIAKSLSEMEYPKTFNSIQTVCPVCGGVMVELRSFWRCGRCNFSMCEDCDSYNRED
jgi:ribosomal protein S27AE